MARQHLHGPIMAPPVLYDLIARWFIMRGREQTFRSMVLDLAEPRPGEAILDVGCGTGTLAIAAKRRIGESGRAVGVDPSAHLLAGARRKAARRSLPIEFQLAGIEELALADRSFDAAFGTFMTHHVPHDLLPRGLAEVSRVLKPGGRVVLVDFTRPDHPVEPGSVAGPTTGVQDLPPLLETAGFSQIESGRMPFRLRGLSREHPSYGYVRAVRTS
ncbi:class I SAM-dependent methyltransferase [Actinopolymorpha pittospori]